MEKLLAIKMMGMEYTPLFNLVYPACYPAIRKYRIRRIQSGDREISSHSADDKFPNENENVVFAVVPLRNFLPFTTDVMLSLRPQIPEGEITRRKMENNNKLYECF